MSVSSAPEGAGLTYTWTSDGAGLGHGVRGGAERRGGGQPHLHGADAAVERSDADVLADGERRHEHLDGGHGGRHGGGRNERCADGGRGHRPDGGRGGGGDARRERQLGPGGRGADVHLDADGAGLGHGVRGAASDAAPSASSPTFTAPTPC